MLLFGCMLLVTRCRLARSNVTARHYSHVFEGGTTRNFRAAHMLAGSRFKNTFLFDNEQQQQHTWGVHTFKHLHCQSLATYSSHLCVS
jgi:hypothetical protein